MLTAARRAVASALPPQLSFHSAAYARHTARRLEHLASLGVPVAGRSVLELGAGGGDLTGYFLDRNCKVTATDSRASNVRYLRRRFPECRTVLLDVENGRLEERFDVVLSYGLLYHLADPEAAVQRMSDWCDGLLLLETCVSPRGDGPNRIAEPKRSPTQAQHGTGSRPGRHWLFQQLQNRFEHVYATRSQPRHPEFPLDWDGPTSGLTRAVFVCSRTPLDLPSLTTDLVDRQEAQV